MTGAAFRRRLNMCRERRLTERDDVVVARRAAAHGGRLGMIHLGTDKADEAAVALLASARRQDMRGVLGQARATVGVAADANQRAGRMNESCASEARERVVAGAALGGRAGVQRIRSLAKGFDVVVAACAGTCGSCLGVIHLGADEADEAAVALLAKVARENVRCRLRQARAATRMTRGADQRTGRMDKRTADKTRKGVMAGAALGRRRRMGWERRLAKCDRIIMAGRALRHDRGLRVIHLGAGKGRQAGVALLAEVARDNVRCRLRQARAATRMASGADQSAGWVNKRAADEANERFVAVAAFGRRRRMGRERGLAQRYDVVMAGRALRRDRGLRVIHLGASEGRQAAMALLASVARYDVGCRFGQARSTLGVAAHAGLAGRIGMHRTREGYKRRMAGAALCGDRDVVGE